jgi:class 3 adenylate cyclase
MDGSAVQSFQGFEHRAIFNRAGALAPSNNPEEARAIVDPALKLMIDAAHRYDGYVVQSTGDGIFAVFGAPVAHEDHPQRAVRAALAARDDLRRRGRGSKFGSGSTPAKW